MAAVRLGRVASTIEAIDAEKPAPPPPSRHDPASAAAAPSPEASTPMLREWSYRGPVPRGPHPHPAPPGASRSSSLPSLPGPVGRSRTPVAFAVKEDPTLTAAEAHQSQAGQPGALGGSRHPWLNAAAASAAVAATMSAVGDQIQICQQQQQQQGGCEGGNRGDDPQQLQPVVATLVTNLAVGLRSGIENMVYAGVAERIEEGGEAVVGEPEHHVLPFLDPATREALSLPPPPSALPDEHGLAMSPPSQKAPPPPPPPRQQQQEPQRQLVPWQQAAPPPPTATQPPPGPEEPCRDLVVRDAGALASAVLEPPLEPPSLFEDQQAKHDEAAAAAGDALRDRADTSDGSLNDWVMDEYDEATFHVEDGKLVEERVPVPSVEYEELYEEAMLAERRGIGCIKRPRRLLARQQHFMESSLEEERERYAADSSPWGRSTQERTAECESAKDDEEHPEDAAACPSSAAAVGKNGFGKARHPVLRWVQRRRKARQQKLAKREKKIAENQASICRLQEQQQHPQEEEEEEEVPQVQSTTTASVCAEESTRTLEDESGYNASSERSARADPTMLAPHGEKANRITKRARRSRSVPSQRRRGKSKSQNKGSVDGNGNSNAGGGARRPKSKSPKRMKNFKKAAKRARKKHSRASFKRSVSLDDVAEARDEDKRDYTDEEELEADPFGRLKPLPTDPRLELRSAGGRTSAAHSNGNACPVAPIAHVIRRSCAAAAANGVSGAAAAPKPDQPHPVLALAATATARVVGGLLHHQQHLLQQQQQSQNQKQPLPRALPLPPLANLLAAVPIPDLPTAVAQEDTKVLEADADAGKNATVSLSPLPPPLHVPPAEVFHMLPPLPGATPVDDSEMEEGQEVLSDEDQDEEDDNVDLAPKDATEGADYVIHTVLPSDTFSGLCLRYKISALELRRANRFSGTNLKLAPSRLVIPLDKTKGGRVCAQDKESTEYKIHEVMAAVKGLGTSAEARAYLLMSGWDVVEAIEAAEGDLGWERDNEEPRSQTLTEKEESEDSVPPALLPEPEAPQTAKAEVGASSDVESLLEDITRVLDELDAYPGVDAPQEGSNKVDDGADDETTAPSLAGTDVSSSSSSSPDSPPAHEPRVVRHHAKVFESLRDKGVLCSPRPPPLHERSRSRSWTAPSSIDVFPSNSPSLKATSKKELPAPDSEETTAVKEGCAVVPQAPAPLQPPARSPLKVVFVGDAVGSIPEAANAARRLASHHRRLRRRSSDLKGRTPTFEVWNGPGVGGNKAAFSHHATQSLFFAPDALYVLFWDMALDDPKTYPRGRRRGRAYSDHSSDEEDEDDLFASEEAARRADRALERRADEEVSVWVDHIMRSLERRCRNCCVGGAGSSRCSILPIAVAPAGADENEVRRRRNLLRSRMLRRCEEWARLGSAATPTRTVVPAPEIVFPEGTVLCMGANDASAEPLRVAVEAVAAGRRREVKPLPRPTSSLRLSDTDSVSVIVRDIVRELKHAHKVVATGHVASLVQKIVKCDHAAARSAVVESLHCLSEEGEVLFFGGAHSLQESSRSVPSWAAAWTSETVTKEVAGEDHNSDDCLLDQFVILSPRWLSSAISCILRPDLKREIVETRELMSSQIGYENSPKYEGIDSEAPLSSSPVIMSADVRMLWQSMAFMREASDGIFTGAEETSLATGPMLFEFLEKVLVRYGVFVPLGTEPGNSFLSEPLSSFDTPRKPTSSADGVQANNSTLYLLPGLMASDPPSDIWTYKAKDSWSTTLCHSWLFHDNVPPGTMERVVGAVLRDMWLSKALHIQGDQAENRKPVTRVHQVMVWGSAFMLRLGMDVRCPQTGERTESVIELFGHLTGATDSSGPPCVAEASMGSSMKRLTVSAKGQAGDAGRKIWDGGLSLVINSVSRALEDVRGGNSIEREIICPDCLSLQHPCHASTWKADWVRSFQQKGHTHMRCGCGHNVEIDLVCGTRLKSHRNQSIQEVKPLEPPVMPVSSLLDGVVVVGLWDGKTKQIRNVGSGFVADKEKGLILTASHILFDMQSRERFGQEFFGIKEAKVVIGVIPKSSSSKGPRCTTAVFRYFAEIVAHDVRKVDACVLRITTKFEEDVGGDGEGCGDQPEVPLKNNIRAMKAEKLYQLKLTKKFELEEDVRILGHNQGGEGRLKPGLHVNRCADFARGYVCKKFKIPAHERIDTGLSVGFNPLEETVVMCPTISGHSGGPCVNSVGSVIGILSRADPADRQRCYLVPASELKKLLKKAKAKCTMSPLDLYYRT